MERNDNAVYIPDGNILLPCTLIIPENASGIVLFAHGSGSSRFSPRNNYAADIIRKCGIGTLLMDLLTEEEDLVYERRFDIDLLSKRLLAATTWLKNQEKYNGLNIGYFGASTGAAAAIQAAAAPGNMIGAVVSRGGRPDLAREYLNIIKSPTLLIVGGCDIAVLELNKTAFEKITAVKQIKIIPGASHLFEEPGTLKNAAKAAAVWFEKYL